MSPAVIIYGQAKQTINQRRGKGNDVARIRRKRMVVEREDMKNIKDWKIQGVPYTGLRFQLKEHLFRAGVHFDSPQYDVENLEVGTEFGVMENNGTSIRYYRIESVRQQAETGDWHLKII